MPHAFLSDDWFTEVDRLRAEAAGQFERGLADGAPTTLKVPFDVAKAMFIDGNQQAAMQAFMSGQVKVEGDMSKLMAMQGAGGPSPEQTAFQQKLKEITA